MRTKLRLLWYWLETRYAKLLRLFGVVRSTYKKADPKIKFNCNMCKVYYENNLNAGKVINRCCPTCASELPSIN